MLVNGYEEIQQAFIDNRFVVIMLFCDDVLFFYVFSMQPIELYKKNQG